MIEISADPLSAFSFSPWLVSQEIRRVGFCPCISEINSEAVYCQGGVSDERKSSILIADQTGRVSSNSLSENAVGHSLFFVA